MDSTTVQPPDDLRRLGQFLGLGEDWGYVDVSSQEAVEMALARWALLRQLRDLRDHPEKEGVD
jgi:hypothetical protein